MRETMTPFVLYINFVSLNERLSQFGQRFPFPSSWWGCCASNFEKSFTFKHKNAAMNTQTMLRQDEGPGWRRTDGKQQKGLTRLVSRPRDG